MMNPSGSQKPASDPAPASLEMKKRTGGTFVFGVLADTRAILLPDRLSALKRVFKGVDMILHVGGIGDARVLEQLREFAPVVAVTGNQDGAWVKNDVRQKMVLALGQARIGLIHGLGKPHGLKQKMLREFEGQDVTAIVYGRNFEPCARQAGGVFFFNPGSFSGGLPEGQKGVAKPRVGLLYLKGATFEGQPGIAV